MKALGILALATCILAACAAPPRLFVNQDGRIQRCAATGWGLAGAAAAQTMNDQCGQDARVTGFLPLEEAGAIGVTSSTDTTSAKILRVSPGSPADRAGIKGGDTITAVDGQKVNNLPDARRLMFGRVNTPVTITYVSDGTERTATMVRWSFKESNPLR